jgi:hypothetical protein
MHARFKQTQPAQNHSADSEFPVEKFDQRHAAGNEIPAQVTWSELAPQFCRSSLNGFLFDEGERFVRPAQR